MNFERRVLAYVLTVCIVTAVAVGMFTGRDIPGNIVTVLLGALSLALGTDLFSRNKR